MQDDKKSFRCDLKELDVNSHYHFGLGRLLAFSSEEARELKQNKVYDKKFSFHSYFFSFLIMFYPRRKSLTYNSKTVSSKSRP